MHTFRRRFGRLALLAVWTLALCPSLQAEPADKLIVLQLGDSMGLCGFSQHLDQRLRDDPQDRAVYTYVACATTPTKWLRRKPFENFKTLCGFLTIKSRDGDAKPDILEDISGMTKGHKPAAHEVPKLEDLLPAHRPDILILQTGNNLFDIFRDQKTIEPARHTAELDSHIQPFVDFLATAGTLRRVYWVSPPISGRVSEEIQEFVFGRIRQLVGDRAVVIDSRPFFTFPYKHMEADKEHFIGAQMDEWADRVYEIIKTDLAEHPLPPAGALAGPADTPPPATTPAPTPAKEISLSATLVARSKPMEVKSLLPYRESLVAYLYDVRSVKSGDYAEKQILILHPAHIDLQPQALGKYKEGEVYTFRLRDLSGTAWETVKTSDETNRIDLTPYLQVEDEARYPGKK